MADLDFLVDGSNSTAVLMVLLPSGSVTHIPKVSPLMILDKCPLLYHTLEFGEYGLRQASIEASSRDAIVSLLRYIYTGNYLADNEPGFLLNHAETFKIAENYDMPELQVAAYVNFCRQTEFSCSLKDPPVLLCETIRFLYEHLGSQRSRQQQSLLDTLLNYCLAVFTYQGLGNRADFRQVVFDLPAFHRDLCRTSMQRGFVDDGALDIVRLPVSSPTPHSHDNLHKRALGDFQFELWQGLEGPSPTAETEESSPRKKIKSGVDGRFTIVHRPKDSLEIPTISDSETEVESSCDESHLMLVHRPKANVNTITETNPLSSCPSSPEPVYITSDNVEVKPQSEMCSGAFDSSVEDDWSLL